MKIFPPVLRLKYMFFTSNYDVMLEPYRITVSQTLLGWKGPLDVT